MKRFNKCNKTNYLDTIWIFRHFLGSFVCILRVAAYLFFHQSRQCQDDKLVCQMVSATKFSFVKNIYVTEKPGNCADITRDVTNILQNTKQLSTWLTSDTRHGPHAAAGYWWCVPWCHLIRGQSEARTGCHQPMRGRGCVVMMWWPSVVITWPRPGPGWPQPVSPRPHQHRMSPGQCQPIRGLSWASVTNQRPVLHHQYHAWCHLPQCHQSLCWPLWCLVATAHVAPGLSQAPLSLSPGPALAPTVCSGRTRDQLWDTGSRGTWSVIRPASGPMPWDNGNRQNTCMYVKAKSYCFLF